MTARTFFFFPLQLLIFDCLFVWRTKRAWVDETGELKEGRKWFDNACGPIDLRYSRLARLWRSKDSAPVKDGEPNRCEEKGKKILPRIYLMETLFIKIKLYAPPVTFWVSLKSLGHMQMYDHPLFTVVLIINSNLFIEHLFNKFVQ